MDHLIQLLENLGTPRMALVGDFILDRYVYGDVERISPEAPVAILKTVRGSSIVGGAGNVAAAATALGAKVSCAGVIGADAAGEELRGLLMFAGAEVAGLVRLKDRPTAVKTRYVGLAQHRNAQQMLRVDEENAAPLGEQVVPTLRAAFRNDIASADVVVIEDYNKGVITDASGPQLIADARAAGKAVIVDPACIADYRRYYGATMLKPNRFEASLASGVNIVDDASLAEASRRLVETIDVQAVLITLDREGAYLYRRDGGGKRIPHCQPRSVYEVTGAGDETLAVLAVAVAAGCDYEHAADLANIAGGLEVEKFGFVPIRREELADEVSRLMGARRGKVLDRHALAAELTRRRSRKEVIVFTNGCFDLLHVGHVRVLQQSRQLGDCLVVAVNSDDSVRRLKGHTRPVIGQAERAAMIEALECVNYVTIFEEDTPMELLDLLRPQIMVKGGTTPVVLERGLVEGYGGKVVLLGKVDGMSTTTIIKKIADRPGQA